ncbi:pyrimidine dimer DNA glycosylase/endonuclease V [Desulfosoma sp.]
MNIFVLDLDPIKCARYHCDQHVVKMILESVQILCTAFNKKGFDTPYKSTHTKHPCVLWAEESFDNVRWLMRLARALNREYKYRYRKSQDHASIRVLDQLKSLRFASLGLTPFAQAMPEKYRVPEDPVTAYRRFYVGEKLRFATWTRRRKPPWIEALMRQQTEPESASKAAADSHRS